MARGVYGDPPGFDGSSEDWEESWQGDEFDDDPQADLDPEGPSAADLERFGGDTSTCPDCGSEVYEDAAICHACGHAFERLPGNTSPWVLIAAVALVVLLLLLFVF